MFILWIACGIIAAAIGHRKGEAIGGLVIGLMLGPLGIIIALLSKGSRKECPYCKELIHKDATVCPRCQRDIYQSFSIQCPSCGTGGHVSENMSEGEVECPSCKKTFRAKNALVD
jgi:hypothetical protein